MFKGRRIYIPSQAQLVRVHQLIALEASDVIGNLDLEVAIKLVVNNIRVATAKVDAVYDVLDPRGQPVRRVYEETKGFHTPEFKLKRRLFEALIGPMSMVQIKPWGGAQYVADTWAGRLPD